MPRSPRLAATLAAVAILATSLQAIPATAAAVVPADLTALVNPFVGTKNFGNTFPGASAPFGMAQVSPDTGGQGGYDYSRNTLYGFSQTHLSGVGCEVMGELPVMPTSGAIGSVRHDQYGSVFSHARESAKPGLYQVHLDRYGVDVALTATARTGWQRYTFDPAQPANVLFNTGKAQQRVFSSELSIVGDRRVEGRINAGNFCAGVDRHTLYFSAEFDRPFASFGTWKGDVKTPGSRESANTGGNGGWVSFDPASDRDVVLKVGLSYTGVAGARANLVAETGDAFDFDATQRKLTAEWNEMLHRIEVAGGTADRQTAFYTALYHSVMHPNVASDVDGNYRGFDGTVRKATDYTPYQNFSLWDTYRPQNQLVELLAPKVARDTHLSVLAHGREGGWLPRWSLANSETNIMTGDPVTPFLVEGWSKGLLKGYEQEAYDLLRKNATAVPPVELPHNGRAGAAYYGQVGYVPFPLDKARDCLHKGGDNDCSHGGSATLEYAAADGSLALMARALGKKADARMFAARAQAYRNIWDSGIGHFRPRTKAGVWLSPYDPLDGSHAFHEGGAYQYQWLVPQDPAGLVDLMGGRRAAEKRLDDFFVYDKLLTDPAGTARTDWVQGPFEYYGKATYNPNNEPDLLAPYMYAWTGAPHKTSTVVRAAMTLFTNGPDGMTGNDDLGTMSAWYVFSSIGLYPTMSGGNFFTVTTPQFESVRLQVGAYGKQGGVLSIVAPGTDDARRYITSARIDGMPWNKPWFSWDQLQRGASIRYGVSDQPGSWGTARWAEPPSVASGNGVPRSTVDAAFSPGEVVMPAKDVAQKVDFSAEILVQDDRRRTVSIRTSGPTGWSVEPVESSVRVTSDGLPVQKTVALSVGIPAGAAPGRYPINAVISSEGLADKTIQAVVMIRQARCAASTATSCAIDLAEYYDHDGTATVAENASGDFDGGGWSYDAALLPPTGAVELGGTTYFAPDATGTAKNFVETTGESILIPAGAFNELRIAGAAHNGTVTGDVLITYDDGSTSTAPLVLTDWAGSPAAGNTVALRNEHRIQRGVGVVGPPVNIFEARLPLTPGKRAQSITLPGDSRQELYAITATTTQAAALRVNPIPSDIPTSPAVVPSS
ncbi:GH92 family glycosyl hydrolase [Kribbella sp. NBC_01245]|uniref:GH92 family glycosyl hydrolase n=1 Tax=Kribbella sp. NBC_01245 TaxID=2903578 RepID=UPI002E2DA2EE|nr:GH92 family glycosyl hydrolase [Kribbella sp. NBC_01245]